MGVEDAEPLFVRSGAEDLGHQRVEAGGCVVHGPHLTLEGALGDPLGMLEDVAEELGEVVSKENLGDAARLVIRGPVVTSDAGHGDSIAVNGVCLTVTSVEDGTFTADVMEETLQRSSLGVLRPGSPVNLERPVRLEDRLGGHLVQGHVDAVGHVVAPAPSRYTSFDSLLPSARRST